jgi:hypothetical protein
VISTKELDAELLWLNPTIHSFDFFDVVESGVEREGRRRQEVRERGGRERGWRQ